MKEILTVILMFLVIGCASTQKTNDGVILHPGKQLPIREPVKEILEVTHFVTFKAPPEGADLIAIDTAIGKEIASLGTTPIRVLLLRKTLIFLDGKVDEISELKPTFNSITYGKGLYGGVEFQFKLRKHGYSDEMVLVRIPFLMGDSEQTIEVVMKAQK